MHQHREVIKTNSATYNESIDYYVDKCSDPRQWQLTKGILRPFVTLLRSRFQSQVHVLEVGPGSGIALKLLKNMGIRLTAIDISEQMLLACRGMVADCEYIKGDFLEWAFAPGCFDGVLANRVIHCMPRETAIQFLNKAQTLLTDRGAICITTNITEQVEEGYFQGDGTTRMRFRHSYSETDLLDVVASARLTILHREYFPYYVDNPGPRGILLVMS